MDNRELVITENSTVRICWSAIFAGTFVGLGLGFLLYLYGIAISLSAFSATPHGADTIAIGGLIGMLVGVIASMGTAGFVAGYLGRFHYHPLHGGVIYGFITWSLIILLSVIMTRPMGHYVTSYTHSLSHSRVLETSEDNIVPNTEVNVKNSNSNANTQNITVTDKTLAWGGWMVFILFFIGALSSCIGASCAMSCAMKCRREQNINPPVL